MTIQHIRKKSTFLTTSYSFYFGGKKGISGNKTSFFLLMQMALAGLPIDDKLLMFLLVLRLPNFYNTLKTVLSSMDSSKVTTKGMASQILAYEH